MTTDNNKMHNDMIIKVCGMRDRANMADVAAAGADWLGMIFWPGSPRCVGMTKSEAGIIPDTADTASACREIGGITRVGVFVDATPQEIITRTVAYGLDVIQLHGCETPTMMANLRKTIDPDIRPGIKLMKTISIGDVADMDRYRMYEEVADYFLFDTRCATAGGSGRKFGWDAIGRYGGSRPFLLSGGIGPDDVERIRAVSHPMLAGIDLNSRFETAPAVKDAALIRTFISKLRAR